MPQSYHITTLATGQMLLDFETQARKQDTLVMEIFSNGRAYTPAQVYTMLIGSGRIHPATPLTSIRRAISNLTKEGRLQKQPTAKRGIYGRPEHYWKIKNPAI